MSLDFQLGIVNIQQDEYKMVLDKPTSQVLMRFGFECCEGADAGVSEEGSEPGACGHACRGFTGPGIASCSSSSTSLTAFHVLPVLLDVARRRSHHFAQISHRLTSPTIAFFVVPPGDPCLVWQ